jgi:LmbE family N-acetylglucosaminyl deacetylase
MITIVSPHADDAVWSLGEHILTWLGDGERIRIVTVFGGVPEDEKGYLKHITVNAEHRAVCGKLGVENVMLSFFDSVYEPRPVPGEISDALYPWLAGRVVAPWGIHHDDHLLVNAAVCVPRLFSSVEWYDELPYYVLYPTDVSKLERENGWIRSGYTSNIEGKKELCRMYASQMVERDEVERCLYVPERHWVPK